MHELACSDVLCKSHATMHLKLTCNEQPKMATQHPERTSSYNSDRKVHKTYNRLQACQT
jgi:hypothetical protein